MAFLDRFRTPAPSKAPLGESGRQQFSGILVEDDHNPDLRGIQGLRELDRMHRADSDARKATRMVANPIQSATWNVVPFGGDDALDADRKIAELVEWAIFEHLGWATHLDTALDVALPLGHAPFEQVWELASFDGRDRWACRLDLRLPTSLYRFWQDDTGRLEAVEQMVRGRGMVKIPASQLVYYRLGARGDNWRGQSLLRPAYKHFTYKEKLELIDMIGQERFAVGTPVGYPPASAGDEARDALAEILAGVRAHEQGFIVSPWPHAAHAEPGQGALIEILMPSTSHDMTPSLKYHSDKIAGAVIQEFMRLGQSSVGARATADVQADPFMAFCEVVSEVLVEDTINQQLIPRLVALNFPDATGLPKLKSSVIDQTTTQELTSAVASLVEKGVIEVDGTLEGWLREHLGLPASDPTTRREPAADAPAVVDPALEDPEQDLPGKLSLARQNRPLTGWESMMQLDRVEHAINGARENFIAACRPATYQLAVQLAANPKRRPPKPDDLADVIAQELDDLYWTGRDTVQQELHAQRPGVRAFRLDRANGEPTKYLRLRAQAAAENVIAMMVKAIKRDVLARSATTQATMQAAAEAAARAALRDEASQNAAFALNAGRADEGDANADIVRGSRYTSILDGNRCTSCATADDDVLRPLDDPVRLERVPPNPGCDGGDRCRCLEWFELADEAPASA